MRSCYEAMKQMVGSFQRRGIFYFRRTIPDALCADLPAVLGTAGHLRRGCMDPSEKVYRSGLTHDLGLFSINHLIIPENSIFIWGMLGAEHS